MKVVVTGATGFIGRRLVKRLLQRNHDVVVLSRRPERALAELGLPVEAHAWDAERGPAPSAAFAGADAVIHLAGESVAGGRWTEARKKSIRDSRVAGTRHLLAGVAQAPDRKPAVLVTASAIGIYGDRGDEALTESSSAGGGFLSQVCQEWEAEAFRAAEFGARVAAIRIGIVLGEDGGALDRMLPLFRNGLGGRLGDGRQWMSWIHADDLVSLLVEAAENPAWSGVFNAVAPEPVTNRDFTTALARAMGKPALAPAPAFALKLALGEMSEVVLGSQRVLPEAAKARGFRWCFETLDSALAAVCTPEVRAGVQVFETRQWVHRPVDELWGFFTEAENLEAITPPWLNFRIVAKSTPSIEKGTLIDYRLRIRGVPARWRTLIESWEPMKRFVDIQLKGPYAKWHHTHDFEPLKGGTLLTDRVVYRLPVGVLGDAVAGGVVGRDIARIFGYRREVIQKRFGQAGP